MVMDRNELRRLLLLGGAALVLSFVWLSYRPAFDAAFIWDDHVLVETSHRHTSFGQLLTKPFWPESPFSDARTPYYRPFVLLSYQLDWSLGGTPNEFHFTNILLHLVTCTFLGIVAVRVGASIPATLLAVALWATFPRLTEDVAWIAGRTDVLAALFGFAALAVWPETGPPRPARSAASLWIRSLAGGVLLFCACASKEIGVAFAGAMLLAVFLRKSSRLRGVVAVAVPMVAYLALRATALSHADVAPPRELGAGRRIITVFESIERYTEMTLDPFHSRTSIGMIGEPDRLRALLGVLVALGAVALTAVVIRRGSFGTRLALALGLLALAPVIQIIPLPLTSAVVADRLLYLPLAALAMGLAHLASHRHKAFAVGALALALCFGSATKARASDYTEETAFWTTAAENAHPHNAAPLMALARWLYDAGEVETACPLYERSLAITERHVETRPPHRHARENLAACWARIGRYDDALRMNRELVRDYPTKARLVLDLGFAELHVRDFASAARSFEAASKLEGGRLASYVVTTAELEAIRTDAERFAQLDTFHQAMHLRDLGRAVEAGIAFHAIAVDPRASVLARQRATGYLIDYGPYDFASEAFMTTPPPMFGWDTRDKHTFARRRTVHRALELLRPRIDGLMR